MKYKKFLGAASAAVMIVIVVTLMLASSAAAASKYKTLHKFTGGRDGADPYAGLVFDGAGNLYGTTWAGGNLSSCSGSGCGVVFELTPNADGSWTEHVLHKFTGGRDGANPPGANLIFDGAGSLYGVTHDGGRYGYGVVFRLTPNPAGCWKESVLHSFTGGDGGGYPYAGLIFDTAGTLYGTATFGSNSYCGMGCGVVFELTPNPDGSWKESVLHSFDWSDGAYPVTGLVFDPEGRLYGTAWMGGTSGQYGLVFELTPNLDGSWTESVLHNFTGGKDGGNSRSGLIFDGAGTLYGTTTANGGAPCCGTAFELKPNPDGSWTEQVLHQFSGGKDGANPWTGLIFDAAGSLYGTTEYGGNLSYCNGKGCGNVFQFTRAPSGSWKETVLHTFWDHPGASPHAGLIFDGAGNLYGTTYGDGTTTFGSVFEITP